MEEKVILIEKDEERKITTIRMNRLKKKNALNYDMFEGIKNAIEEIEISDTRVVVITGGGDSFSAGIDLKTLSGQDPGAAKQTPLKPPNFRFWLNSYLQPIYNKIEQMEKPVIAKINGFCFGAAFELALACDFRFAIETAKLNMVESRIGIISDIGGTTRLVRLVGIPVAKDIMMTGRTFDANEAYQMGLLKGVAKTPEELDKMVSDYADELIEAAPLAVGLAKRFIDHAYGKHLEHNTFLEGLINSQLLHSKDFASGAVARLQKKKPKWRGK
ncbi:MAG: enoyl-CoA hydratase/isomerase family protein [Candidatus Hodarchaeota archaeon]